MNIKNSKFWIWFIPFLLIICIAVWSMLVYLKNKNTTTSDAYKFRTEYAELNNQTNESNGKTYPTVELNNNNPFVYASVDDIKNLFDNGTGVIYFGFPTCPWCRNLVPILNEAVNNTSIEKVYYYNIKSIRSSISFDDNNKLVNEKGDDFYYYLLDKLDSYLTEYTIKDKNNKDYDTKEKRLYAPTVVFVKEGKIIGVHEGTVDSQEDPYVVLDDKQKDELMSIFQDYLTKVTESCDEKC
jgi:thiol-disulfide isomerase/thioredoxin